MDRVEMNFQRFINLFAKPMQTVCPAKDVEFGKRFSGKLNNSKLNSSIIFSHEINL